jgi:hypothetical protein
MKNQHNDEPEIQVVENEAGEAVGEMRVHTVRDQNGNVIKQWSEPIGDWLDKALNLKA